MNSMSKATRACIVREAICDGWGVEDIALRFGIPLKAVQYEVKELRASGALVRMFKRIN